MLKKSLLDSWSFFKNHIVSISLIILPIVAPVDILIAIYDYYFTSEEYLWSEQVIPMIIGFTVYPIYTVGIVFYIASAVSGDYLGTKTLWKLGVKFWLPYILMSIFIGIAVMFGFILLIIPGIIFAIRYAFSEFDLLLNQSKPLDAMSNSWNSTKEYMWVIFGGYAVISIVLFAPYFLVISLFDESSISYWILETALNIIYTVPSVMYTIFAYRVYEIAKMQHNQPLNTDAP